MAALMESPMMQGLLGSPDIMQSMLNANPATRALMEANPELARAMRDPETLRTAAAAARNPAVLAEMMRGQDRALANIEALPGGFNALRRMYNDVQEPLERGMLEGAGGDAGGRPAAPAPPPDAPLPNPWAPAPAAPGGGARWPPAFPGGGGAGMGGFGASEGAQAGRRASAAEGVRGRALNVERGESRLRE